VAPDVGLDFRLIDLDIVNARSRSTAKSARWMEFMQSLGQPDTLNLNLYGSAGRLHVVR